MDQQADVLGKSGLRFFGEMSAANAHEIKNALAVINENAGLLRDLVYMAEKGASLDPLRLKRLAQTIEKQVARADHIAKSSNRFSHSVDKDQKAADLEQSLILVVDMATRFATLRDVHLKVEPCARSITLPVKPFLLLHLLWICLHAAIKASASGNVLTVRAGRAKGATEIRYGPLPELTDAFAAGLRLMPEMVALLNAMQGAVDVDSKAAHLRLTLFTKE